MQSHQSSKTTLGVLLASSAGVAWGLSGVAASTLFFTLSPIHPAVD